MPGVVTPVDPRSEISVAVGFARSYRHDQDCRCFLFRCTNKACPCWGAGYSTAAEHTWNAAVNRLLTMIQEQG